MENFNIYPLPDGGSYFGELNENGLPHSMDALGVWPDGRTYSGSWINGTITGVGTMYQHGEILHYGYWWKGELLHEFPIENAPAETPSPVQGDTGSAPFSTPTDPTPSSNPPKKNKVIALLIGNNNYASNNSLHNCINDAEAIGAELRKIGADVRIIHDATMAELKSAIQGLEEKASVYENVFFLFSGHGNTNQGRHYLQSTDEKIISLEEIGKFLSGTDFKNIILVSDACTTIESGPDDREPIKIAGRTLLVFSSNMETASDGIPGEHSPFAFGLLQYISKPMKVVDIFSKANEFTMAYALNNSFYQQPNFQILPFFDRDLCFYM